MQVGSGGPSFVLVAYMVPVAGAMCWKVSEQMKGFSGVLSEMGAHCVSDPLCLSLRQLSVSLTDSGQ